LGAKPFRSTCAFRGPNATLAASDPGFIALDVAGGLQSFIGAANGSAIGADNVSAILPTGAKQKVPQDDDSMRLGNCGSGSAHTPSMNDGLHAGSYAQPKL